MPTGLALQVALCACANGAVVDCFPGTGAGAPLSLVAINCNASQTRKSQLTQVLQQVADAIDKKVLERATARGVVTRVESTTLATFTEQGFLTRCSGEWKQVLFEDGASFRHLSNLVNLDEAYQFLTHLGLLSEPASKTGGKKRGSGEMASELNRILQTGCTSYACKTQGSFGAATQRQMVGLLAFGNSHPSKYVPVLKQETGQHSAATLERFLQTTGRPVEPHSGLPGGLEVPEDFEPWRLGLYVVLKWRC